MCSSCRVVWRMIWCAELCIVAGDSGVEFVVAKTGNCLKRKRWLMMGFTIVFAGYGLPLWVP